MIDLHKQTIIANQVLAHRLSKPNNPIKYFFQTNHNTKKIDLQNKFSVLNVKYNLHENTVKKEILFSL